jgi:uncharacterized membrane protein YphA (DoxX/SURF4 family)
MLQPVATVAGGAPGLRAPNPAAPPQAGHSPSESALSVIRILLGTALTFGGLFKLTHVALVAGMIEPNGWPLPTASAAAAGVLELVGGLSLAVGFRPRLGAWLLLVCFLIPVTVGVHGLADARHLFTLWGLHPQGQEEGFARAVGYANELNGMHIGKNLVIGGLLLLIALGGGQRWRWLPGLGDRATA